MPSIPRCAMVFAAGRGVRMGALTRQRAKPTLPFCGVPLLTRILRRLRRAGVREVVVNLHYRPRSIEPLLSRARTEEPPSLHGAPFRGEEPSRHLGGAVPGRWRAGEGLRTGKFLRPERRHSGHRRSGPDGGPSTGRPEGEATLLCDPRHHPDFARERRILTDRHGRVTGLGEPGGPGYGFCGVWILEPSALRHLSGDPVGLSNDLLPGLIAAGTGRVFVSQAPWFEIGTPAPLPSPRRWRRWTGGSFRTASSPGVRIGTGANAEPACLLSPGVVLDEDARVERSILLEDVRVGARAALRHVVAAPGETIPDGVVVENSLWIAGAPVPLG